MCYAPIATVYTTINKSNLSCRGRRVITRMAHNFITRSGSRPFINNEDQ